MSEMLPFELAQRTPVRPADKRPPAVAVLEDWLGAHVDGWEPLPVRDWLETYWWGVLRSAPQRLLEQAASEAWARWIELTDPAHLRQLLMVKRGRGKVGKLRAATLAAARQAHGEALLLALDPQRGILARHVRTWAVGGSYLHAGDEVRFRGVFVTVHRVSRTEEDSQQAIIWPRSVGAVPEGWEQDGDYIRRSGRAWRNA